MAEKKTGAEAKGNGITKMEGVRRALTELGRDTLPLQIQKYLKDRFGLTMTVAHISNYKSTILKPAAKKKPATKKAEKESVATAQVQAGPATRPAGKVSTGISLEDLRAVKELVGRVGADTLKALIGLVAP
jgi:hypothetical protein